MENILVPIEKLILRIRGRQVMLDADLALLYDVETKVLVQAVKRNIKRFPDDFMFQLTAEEYQALRSQIVTSNKRGGRRYLPYVFTEQGVAMLSSVLKSEKALSVNIEIIRTFVRLRKIVYFNKELEQRLDELEKKFQDHDDQLGVVFDAIRQLMEQPKITRRQIGFHAKDNS